MSRKCKKMMTKKFLCNTPKDLKNQDVEEYFEGGYIQQDNVSKSRYAMYLSLQRLKTLIDFFELD